MYVYCSLVVTCWERYNLLALSYVMFSYIFVAFPCGVLSQMWYYLSLDTATRPRGHSRQVSAASVSIHLRNLLTHTLLFWHFLKSLNYEFRNTLEYIRTMFSDNARSFSERSDSEFLKYGSLS